MTAPLLPLQSTGLDLSGPMALFAVLVFTAYVAILLFLGYDGWRHSDSLKDFVLGSRSLNGYVVGISFGATYASANMFMGVPGMAYSSGTPALWWSTLGFGLPFIAVALFAKRFWLMSRLGVGDMTLPEWIAERYNSPYLRGGAAILSMFLVFYIVGQGVGAATMFEAVFGVPYTLGLAGALAIVALYVTFGGMHTTIMTDFFQGIIMLGIAVITFGSLWTVVDSGMVGVVEGLSAQDPGLAATYDPGHVIFGGPLGVVLMSWLLFAFILMPHLMNRILVLENPRELKRFVMGAGISLFGMSVFMVWAGLAGRVLFPELSNPDSVVPLYLMEAFPPWLAIVIIVGILSAILTTADSLLHAMTTIVQQDLYKEIWLSRVRKVDTATQSVDRNAVWVGRVASVIIAGAAFVIGMERPDSLFMLTQIGIAGLLSGTAVPIILGYLWKGSTRRGAEVGFSTGVVVYVLLFFGIVGGSSGNQFLALFVASAVSAVSMTVTSIVDTAKPIEEQQTIAFGRTSITEGTTDD